MTSRSTMYYVETSAQRSQRLNIYPNPVAQFLRRTYWAYYAHLPFYGLTNWCKVMRCDAEQYKIKLN
ncbi:hypothetical protein ZYGR_0P02690 [Zygosaccharomyces rouxii]|uniref:Uncharacterized protein n=1 Tax=Zygosaccharomyces rouxii TaxID=4956 RepID=A0A1Q3A1M1_ZYGRO|nr:hypothetical protein ZYGR_0P02690 [Zygosaccharomyces rouxii]